MRADTGLWEALIEETPAGCLANLCLERKATGSSAWLGDPGGSFSLRWGCPLARNEDSEQSINSSRHPHWRG